MRNMVQIVATVVALLVLTGAASGQKKPEFGKEEFGLTGRQLALYIDKVERKIAELMRERGFKYVPIDVRTVRKGMSADKQWKDLSEEVFHNRYGFGVATLYTGQPPQLSDSYCPAREGLGPQNIKIFKGFSPADQVAYNRALFGKNTDASFAVGLETENFSRCGGCTLEAIKAVFPDEVLKADYYNPLDAYVNKHWLMKRVLREYQEEMRKAGFSYSHPDQVEPDIRARLDRITGGETIPVEKLSPGQKAALEQLKKYELDVAKIHYGLATNIFDPVEERIHKEYFSGKVE